MQAGLVIKRSYCDKRYCLYIKSKQYGLCTGCGVITSIMDISYEDINRVLKLYNGYIGALFAEYNIYFYNKEDGDRFISEYLEPLLIIRQLS